MKPIKTAPYRGPGSTRATGLRAVGALVSAGLVVLAGPRFELPLLGLFGLVPLVLALRGARPRQAAVLGGLFGLAQSLGQLYWIAGVVEHYGHLPSWAAGGILFLLLALMAIYPLFFSLAVAFLWTRPAWLVWGGGFLWVGLEWIRSWFLSGFPWMDLGYILTPWTLFTQMADLGGVALAGLLVVALNLALAQALAGPRRYAGLALAAAAWAGAFFYGQLSLGALERAVAAAPQVEVQAVQGNINQDKKWDEAFIGATLDTYFRLTRETATDRSRLVVWPETCVPYYFGQGRPEDRRLTDFAREEGAWLLFGAPAYERKEDRIWFYNRAWLLTPAGGVAGYMDKSHLVPYGEYVPLKSWMPFLGKIVEHVGDYSPGHPGGVVRAWFGQVGGLICYETIFPELARQKVAAGAALLVNMTNDAWFGQSLAPHQHLAMLTWRAVEQRRGIVRAAQTGISALIDPAGRIVASLGLGREGQLSGRLPILLEKSIYHRIGWMFHPACLVVAGVLLLAARMGRRDDLV